MDVTRASGQRPEPRSALPARLTAFLDHHAVSDAEIASLLGKIGVTSWAMLRKQKGKRRAKAKKILHRWIIGKAGRLDQSVTRALYEPLPIERAAAKRPPRATVYSTDEWKRLRFKVLTASPRCGLCGATTAHGAVLNVDHVRPVKTHPHLALDESNLQVLCSSCNWGKGNRVADFRDRSVGQ